MSWNTQMIKFLWPFGRMVRTLSTTLIEEAAVSQNHNLCLVNRGYSPDRCPRIRHSLMQSLSKISPQITSSAPSPYPPRTLLPKFLPRSLPSLSWSLEKLSSTSFLPVRLSKKLSAIWMLKDGYQHAAIFGPQESFTPIG